MKAIIPTGGRGTRMQPLTFSTNKHFIPVGNKPLIHYPIEAVAESGIKEVAITYNPGWLEYVKDHLGTGSKWGLKFTYVLQEKPLGLANIVEACESFIGNDRFLLHLGDNIFSGGIKEMVEKFEKSNAEGIVAKIIHPENWRMGVPVFDNKGNLKDYIEKPKKPPNKYAVPGIYFLSPIVFKCFKGKDAIKPSKRGEYEIVSPYLWLVKKGYKVLVEEYSHKWLDPGKFDDWISTNQYLLDLNTKGKIYSKLDKSVKIDGRVDIGKNCKIKNTEIRGPVSIADNVVIKDSYIGPYSSVSDNCIIDKCHIENSVLMGGVRIDKIKKPIDQSVIGTSAEIFSENGPVDCVKLFIGEKSVVKI